jgi:putative intracellular protease/amidase
VKAQTLRLETLVSPVRVQVQAGIYVVAGPGTLVQLQNPAVLQGLAELAAAPTDYVARVTVEIHPVTKDTSS